MEPQDTNNSSVHKNAESSTSSALRKNLLSKIESWVFGLQSILDKFKAPLQMQDDVMRMIFSEWKQRKGKKFKKTKSLRSLFDILLDEDFLGLDNRIPVKARATQR